MTEFKLKINGSFLIINYITLVYLGSKSNIIRLRVIPNKLFYYNFITIYKTIKRPFQRKNSRRPFSSRKFLFSTYIILVIFFMVMFMVYKLKKHILYGPIFHNKWTSYRHMWCLETYCCHGLVFFKLYFFTCNKQSH